MEQLINAYIEKIDQKIGQTRCAIGFCYEHNFKKELEHRNQTLAAMQEIRDNLRLIESGGEARHITVDKL